MNQTTTSQATGPDEISFFHSFKLPDGEAVAGYKSEGRLKAEADLVFRFGVQGKSVLDVGAWDGYQSFQAEQRGAERVTATDHFCWSGEGWGDKRGFDYVKSRLGSEVQEQDIDVPDIAPKTVGVHDVVLLLGVLYHAKDPLTCLERMASVTGEVLIIETETALDYLPWPVMRYYERSGLNNDVTNYWAPNTRCVQTMLREIGFSRFDVVLTPSPFGLRRFNLRRRRIIMHAWK